MTSVAKGTVAEEEELVVPTVQPSASTSYSQINSTEIREQVGNNSESIITTDEKLQPSDIRQKLLAKCPTASILIDGVQCDCVLDTGAEASLISWSFYHEQLESRSQQLEPVGQFIRLVGANNLEIPVLGYLETSLEALGQKMQASFLVAKDTTSMMRSRRGKAPIILGCNVLRKLSPMISRVSSASLGPDWDLALHWLRSAELVRSGERIHDTVDSQTYKVWTRERSTIPPNTVQRISCAIDEPVAGIEGRDFLLHALPLQLSFSGSLREIKSGDVFDPSVLCQVLEGTGQFNGAYLDVFVANASAEPLIFPSHTDLAIVSEVVPVEHVFVEHGKDGFDVQVHQVVFDGVDVLEVGAKIDSPKPEVDIPNVSNERQLDCVRERFVFPDGTEFLLPRGIKLDNLNPEEAVLAANLIQKHEGAFSKDSFDLGFCDLIPHRINLTDDKPVNLPYRRVTPNHVSEVKQLLQDLLDRQIIRKSASPYASPIVLVRKKNGQLRLCIDYRLLNAKTVKDAFPLPRIEETLECLSGSRLFSSLDMAHGYFQVALHEDSIPKTAFRVPWGLYEFLRLPQGLSNSPSTFQRIVELIFGDLNLTDLVLYLDDLLVFSGTFQQHLERLEKVFERLERFGLKLNGKKCQLFRTSVHHLGHIVSDKGVSVDPEKTARIRDWPVPTTIQQLRSFLGLASYYRRFVAGFSKIAEPLHALTRKAEEKVGNPSPVTGWSEDANNSFNALKQALCEAPVLGFPCFDRDFVLEVDASLKGLGACLCQYDDSGKLHPVAYASRGLRGAERGYSDLSSFKLEFLALKWAVSEKFREYLLGRHTVVWTDNNPLAHLKTAKLGAVEQRWAAQLASFDLEIRYRSGKSNKCADALSRFPSMPESEANMVINEVDNGIATPVVLRAIHAQHSVSKGSANGDAEDLSASTPSVLPSFTLEELAAMQQEDKCLGIVRDRWRNHWEPGQCIPTEEHNIPEVKGWVKEWSRFEERNGILYRVVQDAGLGKVMQYLVPRKLRSFIMDAAHDQWGHQGVGRTLSFIKQRAFWPGMSKQVHDYVGNCFQCCVTKVPTPSIRPPMRHLLAFQPLERVSMDFVKLDSGVGNIEDVLVLTDTFTKFALAVPCRDQSAPTVARALRDSWFVHYGIPAQIHSDQGRNFESSLIQELCRLYGIKKTRTTPYHPQGNGQVERFNRTLCGLIKSLDKQRRQRWPELLPHLVYIYNNTPHSVTGYTPYALMFGRESVVPLDHLLSNTRSDWNESAIQRQAQIIKRTHQVVKDRLSRAADQNKRRYDRRANTSPLAVGSRVLMKQCAYRGRHKLQNVFKEEPYIVVKCGKHQDLFLVKPTVGGESKWVNRKMLIIDPRKEPCGLNGDDPLGCLASPSDSDSDVDGDDGYVLTIPPNFFEPPQLPEGKKDGDSEEMSGPRRSKRLMAKKCL